MSALFRAELYSLQRLVAWHERQQLESTSRRDQKRAYRAAQRSEDEAAVENVLRSENRPMGSAEIGNLLGISRPRIDCALDRLGEKKIVTRRHATAKRADGDGNRKIWKYRIKPD